MTLIDGLLMILVISGAAAGFRQGFVAAACSLLGAVVCSLGALALAPVLVQNLDSGLARTALAMALLIAAVLIGELAGGWAGRTLSQQITWRPARAADRTLGMLGQAVAVLGLAWVVALPLAAAPIPWLSSSIRNSTILTSIDKVTPDGTDSITGRLRDLLNSTGFPNILGPLDATPIIDVPEPNGGLVTDPVAAAVEQSVLKIRSVATSCGKTFSGTGFVIGPEHVLTNAHVVGGSSSVSVEVGGNQLAATVVDYNSDEDLAVLYIPGLNLPSLNLDQQPLASGADAIVLGYPLAGPFTVSPARVRSVIELSGPDIYQSKTVDRQVYLLRALVRPGNSGGPVVDANGQVVGIVFGAAIDNAETGFALTAREIAGTVAVGITDTSPAGTASCALE